MANIVFKDLHESDFGSCEDLVTCEYSRLSLLPAGLAFCWSDERRLYLQAKDLATMVKDPPSHQILKEDVRESLQQTFFFIMSRILNIILIPL